MKKSLFLCLLSVLALLPLLARGEIKIVTYNIRLDTTSDKGPRDWSRRAPGLVKFFKEGQFSIIGLQEAKHNQLRDLEQKLPGYSRVGVGRADGKEGGEYSPVLFDPGVWTADEQDQGTFWLSDTPEVPGSTTWGNQVTRICTWVRLIDEKGRGLYVYNMHFDHQSQPSREKAAHLVLKRIKARPHSKDPVILMGDLNATTRNPAVKTLLESGLLVDPGGAEQKSTGNRWEPGLKDGLRIDHVFTSPSLPKGHLEVVSDGDPVHSDHHPVILTIPSLVKE